MFTRFTNIAIFFIIASVFFVVGCGGANVPKDFPKTMPYTITVVDGGKPIEGVIVRLSTTTSPNWTASGVTNASGVAELQTISGSYSRKGAPEGSYKVVMVKPLEVDPALLGPVPEDLPGQVVYNAKLKELQSKMTPEVPLVYSLDDTTPVSIEIAKGKKQETIDVGKQ